MSDNMMIDGSDDNDYLENDYNESSHTSASTSPFQNNRTLECSLTGSLVTVTTPTSANSGDYYFPLDWELPSHLEPVQTANLYYPPFENFLELTFSHATDVESAICRDVNDCEPYIREFSTLSMSSPPSQQANLNTSQTSGGMRSREALNQESNQLPQIVTSNVLSSMPQMTLTIDNPDPRTVASILEVLTKAKSKVTISMNT
jgi:hypothetical protein